MAKGGCETKAVSSDGVTSECHEIPCFAGWHFGYCCHTRVSAIDNPFLSSSTTKALQNHEVMHTYRLALHKYRNAVLRARRGANGCQQRFSKNAWEPEHE
jgi:hypothetical protein